MIVRASWFSLALAVAVCAVATAQRTSPTTISVSLPADAALTINGQPTAATGELREFRDSQAAPENTYRYALRATVERGGRLISQVRSLRLTAGTTQHVRFEFPQEQIARKPLNSTENVLLAQANDFQSRFQPRPGPANDGSSIPAQDEPAIDGFQPRTPDLTAPIDSGTPPTAELQLPPLGAPADDNRFGRQFGEEPEAELAPTDRDLLPSEQPARALPRFEPIPPAVAPLHEEKAGDQAGDTMDSQKSTSNRAAAAAYIGRDHQHHLTGDSATALHIWQNQWRLVRLERSNSKAGPYMIYHEVNRPGFDWAYGQYPFECERFPVFFKPGAKARWCFVGYAQRVRPFTQ